MAKRLVFFAAVVFSFVALAAAEGDDRKYNSIISRSAEAAQLQCERELQESSLKACRQVVDQEMDGQVPWNLGLQLQCCQQLRDVSPKCRPVAISQVVNHFAKVILHVTRGAQRQGGVVPVSYQQPEQGYHPSITSPQQPAQGQQGCYPRVTSPQQPAQEQPGWYPSVTSPQQPVQYPSGTSSQQPAQGQQGFYPSVSSPQQPTEGQPGSYPSVTSPQQPIQYPSVTSPQQPAQGKQGFYPSVTSPQQPSQGQPGLYPSVTSPQQPIQGQQGQAQGAYQPGTSSPQQQQPTNLQVANVQQFPQAAFSKAKYLVEQLPAMCGLEGGAVSASQ